MPDTWLFWETSLKLDFIPQLQQGIQLYKDRMGKFPDKIKVNPYVAEEMKKDLADLKIQIEFEKYCLRNCALIGTAWIGGMAS